MGNGGADRGLGCHGTPAPSLQQGINAVEPRGWWGQGAREQCQWEGRGPYRIFGCCTMCTASFRACGTAQGDIVFRRNRQPEKGVAKPFP